MATQKGRLGALGERLAADYLQANGYLIWQRNFRCPVGEIDIIAERDGCLAFVEVRTRRGASMGTPEESITKAKKEHMLAAAATYCQDRDDLPSTLRLDVIAVVFAADGRLQDMRHLVGAVSADAP